MEISCKFSMARHCHIGLVQDAYEQYENMQHTKLFSCFRVDSTLEVAVLNDSVPAMAKGCESTQFQISAIFCSFCSSLLFLVRRR